MAFRQRDRWTETDQAVIRQQLDRILRSRPFQQSQRRQKFLAYLVNETLAGRSERLKGYSIGLEVFDRSESFDPLVDPIVRIEATRLREKLREYYVRDGEGDAIRIELPKGTYTPRITFRQKSHAAPKRVAHPATQHAAMVPSVAVLSFDDLSADGSLSYLGDGVAEDIITALSRFPDLVVVARGSSFAYKGKSVDLRQIGKELGVAYVVEGSVRKDGDKLRIVAQLIETKNGKHVWAERFDKLGADPWVLQDDITAMVVSALTGEKGALKQAEYLTAWDKEITTLEEYDYYLRGHDQLMRYTKEGIERSGQIWREGLVKFPNSQLLKVKLGWHHMVRDYMFVGDDSDVVKAGELVRQILGNEHLSLQVARLANWLMSYVLVREKDFEGAFAAAERTVAIAPYDMFVLSRLMMVLVQVGRPELALQWADLVAARDPALGWFLNYGRGFAYLVTGRFDEAVAALKQTDFNDAHLLLAIAYRRVGLLAEARAEVDKIKKTNSSLTVERWRQRYCYKGSTIFDGFSRDLARSGLSTK
jgi:adenylate cyclase